ncbi:MAG: OmpA family protein [Verrucomicrobiaceae bacterium]|nr:OmpA family protein [Verrucomicrobiaceae bacterium]
MTQRLFSNGWRIAAFSLPLLPALLGSCSLFHSSGDDSQVIYALPSRQPGTSPLGRPITSIGGPYTFSRDRFVLTDSQAITVARAAPQWVKDKTKLLVVGYAQRGLPPDYARVLAHRRAESVRQVLIEHGLDAGNIHSAGYGNDEPSISTEDSVMIYELK